MSGPAGATRPRGLPAPSLSLASLPPLPPVPAAAPELLPAPPRSGPRALPRLTPRDLRSGLEMQLAEDEKALPGRRPSPSREMSAMGGRGAALPCSALPMPGRSLKPAAGPGSGHLAEEAGFKCDLASAREISLRGVKTDFFCSKKSGDTAGETGMGGGLESSISVSPEIVSDVHAGK